MPPLKIRCDFKTQQNQRHEQKQLDAQIESRLHRRVAATWLAVGVLVGVSVGPSGGDPASYGGSEDQHCGAEGGEAAGGTVGLEEEDPSELLGVFAAAFVSGSAGRLRH